MVGISSVSADQTVRSIFVEPTSQVVELLGLLAFGLGTDKVPHGRHGRRATSRDGIEHVLLQRIRAATVLVAVGVERLMKELCQFLVGADLIPGGVAEDGPGIAGLVDKTIGRAISANEAAVV